MGINFAYNERTKVKCYNGYLEEDIVHVLVHAAVLFE